MNDLIKHLLRPRYWTIRKLILNNPLVHTVWLNQHSKPAMVSCPVCDSKHTFFSTFHFEGIDIAKYLCKECGHLFSSNLQRNLDQAEKRFNYQHENKQISGQVILLEKLVGLLSDEQRNNRFSFLDFGTGGNLGASENMRQKYPKHQFFACDLYPFDSDFYFQSYSNDSRLGFFDGIASNAVIEHLDNTIEAWTYLNQLLKPVKSSTTYMVHAFPSQINEDPWHWTIRIKSHECLFSKSSLQLVCKKTGFQFISMKYIGQVQHPVFYFKKVADL